MVGVVDIFDEVSEDLRAERARALLARYGGLLVGACVLVLILVAGWQWNQARADKENQRVSTLFVAATNLASAANDDASRAAALAAFQQVEQHGHKNYTVLAKLNEAALKYEGGDLNGALVLWDQVAGDGNAPIAIRDLSALFWVQHQIDSGDPAQLTGRLSPLLAPSNMWHGLASEQMALLLLRQGKTDQARDRLLQLEADTTVPQNARSRAAALLASLSS